MSDEFREPSPWFAVVHEGPPTRRSVRELAKGTETSIHIAFQDFYGAVPREVWEAQISAPFWDDDRWLAEAVLANVYPDAPVFTSAGPEIRMQTFPKPKSGKRQTVTIFLPTLLISAERRAEIRERLRMTLDVFCARGGTPSDRTMVPADKDRAARIMQERVEDCFSRWRRGPFKLFEGPHQWSADDEDHWWADPIPSADRTAWTSLFTERGGGNVRLVMPACPGVAATSYARWIDEREEVLEAHRWTHQSRRVG